MARKTLTLEPIAGDPEVGRWLAAMQDARKDTLRELDGVTGDALDLRPGSGADSIGTILYHIALIEADWLLVDILGAEPAPTWAEELFPHGVRSGDGHLTAIEGTTLKQHLDRLAIVRSKLLEHMQPMTLTDFHQHRAREQHDVAPIWVIHHLLQHEAEHRSQIGWLKAAQKGVSRR